MAVQVRALGYVSLRSTAVEAWPTFAVEGLGLAAGEARTPGQLAFRTDQWAARLLVAPGSVDRVEAVGWQLRDGLALERAAVHLEAAGVKVRWGTEAEAEARFVEELVAFDDPAGNPLELFHSPMLLDEPELPRVSGFVGDDQGLGHVVLPAGDLPETFDFYRRTLGFEHRDSMLVDPPGVRPYRMRFLSCNRRHHSVALTEAEAPTGLRHLMVNVAAVEDVGVAFDRCRALGLDLKTRIGQHSNDLMISFYLRSPGGFEVEYATGGLEVDDATWSARQLRAFRLWGYEPLD